MSAKNLLAEKRARLEQLINEMKPLEEAKDLYYKLSWEAGKLRDWINDYERRTLRQAIQSRTDFVAPTFPCVGSQSENGSATFLHEGDGQQLIQHLSTYYVGYALHWTKPGNYVCVPEHRYDHDGDLIHTGHFYHEDDLGK